MEPIKNISIPTPCHQSWQQMQPVDAGRHCSQCAKTVIDFTMMTNDEIVAYLSTASDICGRFDQQQLKALNQQVYNESVPGRSNWKNWIMAASLFVSAIFLGACAQSTPPKQPEEQLPVVRRSWGRTMGKVLVLNAPRFREISGRVTDESNRPVFGACITISPGTLTTQSDHNGYFNLRVRTSAKQLAVHCTDFANRSVIIGSAAIYNVELSRPDAK